MPQPFEDAPLDDTARPDHLCPQSDLPGRHPTENVVIDLSNNTGGQADAAVFVISWVLATAISA